MQDETGGFTAFICWTFQPGNTDLAGPAARPGPFEYLKTLAVSRLYLDNFANLQASWVTQGLKIGQMALRFGANDMGSLMIEENVVAAAGTSFRTTEAGDPPRDRRGRLSPRAATCSTNVGGRPAVAERIRPGLRSQHGRSDRRKLIAARYVRRK